MRKKLSFLILILIIGAFGCTDEPEPIILNQYDGEFEYKGQVFETPIGYISNRGLTIAETGMYFDVLFCTPSAQLKPVGWIMDVNSSSHAVFLKFVTPSLESFETGYYDFQYAVEPGHCSLIDVSIEGKHIEAFPKECKVQVSEQDSIFKFTYYIKFENGEEISGYYKGKLEVI